MNTSRRKRIRLRYDDSCVRCGQPLPAGTYADWSPDSRDVCCVTCSRTPQPQPAGSGRGQTTDNRSSAPQRSRGQTVSAAPADPRWRELLDYYVRCLERESIDEPPTFAGPPRWVAVTGDE